jgi:hypothetical protein
VGIGLMVFFFLSDVASATNLNYFCWSVVLLTLGFFFQGQFKRPPGPPSGRFSVFGKIKSAFKRKPKEEKKKDEKKK